MYFPQYTNKKAGQGPRSPHLKFGKLLLCQDELAPQYRQVRYLHYWFPCSFYFTYLIFVRVEGFASFYCIPCRGALLLASLSALPSHQRSIRHNEYYVKPHNRIELFSAVYKTAASPQCL